MRGGGDAGGGGDEGRCADGASHLHSFPTSRDCLLRFRCGCETTPDNETMVIINIIMIRIRRRYDVK